MENGRDPQELIDIAEKQKKNKKKKSDRDNAETPPAAAFPYQASTFNESLRIEFFHSLYSYIFP